jgi:hexosaminidase
MKKIALLLIVIVCCYTNCLSQFEISIIPKPQKLLLGQGMFVLQNNTSLIYTGDVSLDNELNYFTTRILVGTGINLKRAVSDSKKAIIFINDKSVSDEGYKLEVSPNKIELRFSSVKGAFYGVQTILQLLPAEVYGSSPVPGKDYVIPAVKIEDYPRFSYRGMHLDVGRHFFEIDAIKKLLDLMAIHKLNTFHWHLTEDQGWRIEIKKYPLLTQVGSIRAETMLGHYSDQKWDGKPYGGFYTQEQIKEVVNYAKLKHIEVIPEIEMPGHALAALAAYPEYGCKGANYKVGTKWGVEDDVFCPYDKTFEFLENVISEVIDLFPSKYIHIGGDECPKTTWKESEFCQNLMKKEKLKDEHELQSFFIKRMDKFISSKGKKIIGWDEILEGGISPNATIMSWRGIEGGISAVKEGHDAIMTPTSFCYLDYYQSDPSSEPLAIGGYLPLENVYSYEPIPAGLSPQEAKHILGTQANLWTEYISTEEKMQYMMFPRATAIAEIAWSSKEKDFNGFSTRLKKQFERMDNLGVNYAKSYYDVSSSMGLNANQQIKIALKSLDKNAKIRYTLDGSIPTANSLLYSDSKGIFNNQDFTLNAAVYNSDGKQMGKIYSKYFSISKSTGKKYTIVDKPDKYTGGETYGLTNGVLGNVKNSATWVGLDGKDFNVVLDLGQKIKFERCSMAFMRASAMWVMLPRAIEIFVSNDNKAFKSVKKLDLNPKDLPEYVSQQYSIDLGVQNARYVKVIVKNYGDLPKSHQGFGHKAWLFLDEISIK